MTQYVVIGTSPFNDVSVGIGPFRTATRALAASRELDDKGYNTEVVELSLPAEIDNVTNDEGVTA